MADYTVGRLYSDYMVGELYVYSKNCQYIRKIIILRKSIIKKLYNRINVW